MPPTNSTLQTVATAGGIVYTGKTIIRFNSGGNMTVTNALVNGGSPQTRALPANGVIYVKNNTGNCGTIQPPSNADYDEGASCGNLYISGTYTSSMTLAAANDIIVAPPGAVPLSRGDVDQPGHGRHRQRRPDRQRQLGHGPRREQLRARVPPVQPRGVAADEERAHRRRDPLAGALVHGRQPRLRLASSSS